MIAKVLERHMSEPLPPTAVLEALPFTSLDDLRRPVEAFRFPKRDGAVVFVLAKTGGGKSATMVRLMRMAAETSLFRCGRFYSGYDLPLPSSRAASDVLVWDVDRPVSPPRDGPAAGCVEAVLRLGSGQPTVQVRVARLAVWTDRREMAVFCNVAGSKERLDLARLAERHKAAADLSLILAEVEP